MYGDCGLSFEYRQTVEGIRLWIRRHIALACLPTWVVEDAHGDYLADFPATVADQYLREKCRRFAAYLRSQSLQNPNLPIDRWNHYQNIGHRTTNMAEGWHNALNHYTARAHLPLRTFLDDLQKVHAIKLARIDQLNAGQEPKPKKQIYVRLNQRLARYFVAFEEDYLHNAIN